MSLSTQVVSAQALSVGTFSQIKASMAEQRVQAREVAQTSAEIQGDAALREADATKEAMLKEAEIKENTAMESFTNAGSTIAGEGLGRVQEWRSNNTVKAQASKTNLEQAEIWQDKLRGMQHGEAAIHIDGPVQNGQAAKGLDPAIASRKRQAMEEARNAMTTDELNDTLKNIHLSEGGRRKRYDALTPQEQAALQHGITTDSPEIRRLRKQADKDVKTYRAEVDNISNSASRGKESIVQISRAMGTGAGGAFQVLSSQRQAEEAELRYEEAINKYLSDTALNSGRQFNEVAGSITGQIRSLDESLRAMQERV